MSYGDQTTLGISTTAPGSSATITLFDTSSTTYWERGSTPITEIAKRLVFKIDSSHDSAASGVIVEFSSDGTNWDGAPAFPMSYTTSTGLATYDILLADKYVRVKYTNSANVLTLWKIHMFLAQDRAAAA